MTVPGAQPATHTVAVTPAALWVYRGEQPQMAQPHRHDDIEVNVVLNGRLDYIFGGQHLTLRAGQVAIFWAATPHHLIVAPGVDPGQTRGCWIHIPLSIVLNWRLPDHDIGRLLQISALIAPMECLRHDPDRLFASWEQELQDPANDAAAIPVLLEIEALLRRTLRYRPPRTRADDDSPSATLGRRPGSLIASVTAMATFIIEHFREQITIDDIAAAAHLNRTYAATIFSRTLGTTPGRYLTQCRITEAQRLLITTTKTMIDIAHTAGFNSQSSFYDHFTRRCSISPGAYRQSLGGPHSTP